MADPVTMLMVAAGGSAVTKGLGALAGYQSGRAEADVLRQNAQAAEQQTAQAEEAQRREAAQLLGRQAAAVGESGIGFTGSAQDLMRQSAIDAELDALNIRYEGQTRAQGLRTQARLTKKAARTSLYLGLAEAGFNAAAGVGIAKAAKVNPEVLG